MGEYIARFGSTSWSVPISSQELLNSFYGVLEEAMQAFSKLEPGRCSGTYGGWEFGINTETNVIYHAFMK